MRLVVGLGNPGVDYAGTRHNVGWAALDVLAQKLGWIARASEFNAVARTRFDGLMLDGTLADAGEKILLLKPTTYMNDSGRSVQQASAFYQIDVPGILVVLDDLALPCGRLRIRPGGSSGGHNGLKDVQRVLGTQDYPRLRIGIDAPPPRVPGKDYVLSRFTEAQQAVVNIALDRAAAAIVMWAKEGIEAAMNAFNPDTVSDTND